MQSVELCGADSAERMAQEMVKASDMNCLVIKNFVGDTCQDFDLLEWAKLFCELGEPVTDQLCYYEGHLAKPGETFNQQLQRQMEEDFRNCAEELDQGSVSEELATGSSSAVKALLHLLERLMLLHEACQPSGGKGELRWKVNFEVNQNGACTKYHNDRFDNVRFAVTLAGDGTVLADQAKVDWDFLETCQRAVPALAENPELSAAEALAAIREWNETVCPGHVATEPGDLVIMKGGQLTKRPCLRRAPYSAGEGFHPARLLITLDLLPKDELQQFIDMDFGDADGQNDEPVKQAPTPRSLLPATVLSGFLGAGKTALLTNLLRNQEGLRVAVIVNLAEVDVDGSLLKSGSELLKGQDKMVEMQKEGISCILREDLIENVTKLAAEKRFDYLLIESTGISEPMPVATTFVHEHDGKTLLGTVARLDTLVTVVDASSFLKDYDADQQLRDRRELGADENDPRTIAQLLIDQVECANVIVLNKVDLVQREDLETLEALLKKLNPKAKVVRSTFGKVDSSLLLNTRSFDMEEVERMPGWFQELQGNHVPDAMQYGVASLVFRAQKPFHPKRLDELLKGGLETEILRSKGRLWVAGLDDASFVWHQAGSTLSIDAGPGWLHGSLDPKDWPADTPEEYRTAPYGDRRQELVFIGKDLDQDSLRQRLEQSLVTEVEFEQGREEWARWPNPFKGTDFKPARKKGNLAARRAALRRKRAAAPAAAGGAPQASRPKKAKTVQRSQKSGQGTSDAEALCYLREESEALLQASESKACCASCGVAGFWWTLRWSSEDGQGYCQPCWLHWSSDLQDNQQRPRRHDAAGGIWSAYSCASFDGCSVGEVAVISDISEVVRLIAIVPQLTGLTTAELGLMI
ncbi:unnamed protein product [Symbiodinium sp. CCMP2456]|nr:unnamed protein product [Symbiodinium sp. CCMP2456]